MLRNFTPYLVSVIALLFLLEFFYSYRADKHLYTKKDTLNNISIGVVTLLSETVSKFLVFFLFGAAFKYHVFTIGHAWWAWILTFIGSELAFYWFHRASHEINWFWASHVMHHSSEEYNYSVAVRTPWFPQFTGKFLFWIWMPVLGFEPIMIMLVMQLQYLYQGILHTKTVGKLPAFIEYAFNTPSHHRVHHSCNLEYLDKNHAGVLILLDRIFGTFAEEKSMPVYGLSVKTRNETISSIVFHEWIALFKNASKAGSFKNSLYYAIMPPGWSHDGSTKTVAQMRRSSTANLETLTKNQQESARNAHLCPK